MNRKEQKIVSMMLIAVFAFGILSCLGAIKILGVFDDAQNYSYMKWRLDFADVQLEKFSVLITTLERDNFKLRILTNEWGDPLVPYGYLVAMDTDGQVYIYGKLKNFNNADEAAKWALDILKDNLDFKGLIFYKTLDLSGFVYRNIIIRNCTSYVSSDSGMVIGGK